MIWMIIPGMAFKMAPPRNICQLNPPLPIPRMRRLESPQTRRPEIMATISQIYVLNFEFGSFSYKNPVISPYVASSNAIVSAFGIAGMEKRAKRSSGVIRPTARPYFQPQINPQRRTGMCIGNSLFPISRICPVRNGSISPSARKSAASVNLRIDFIVPPIQTKNQQNETSLQRYDTFLA